MALARITFEAEDECAFGQSVHDLLQDVALKEGVSCSRKAKSFQVGPAFGAVCPIRLAVNRQWKDKVGEPKEEVRLINCTAFGRTAEIMGCAAGVTLS